MDERWVLACERLVRFYDTASGRVQAVRGVDLELEAGVVAAVVGPSGSGKSSLLRMLAGLDRPTAGSVHLGGVDLWAVGERARARQRAAVLSHVFQRPDDNLFAHLSVDQQLARVAPPGGEERVEQWLERMGLASRRHLLPSALSGGERQRLAFARAGVAGHRVVLADEPTSQLDSASAAWVMDGVASLARSGVTLVLATHDRRVLERVDQVIALRDGAVASVTSGGSELAVIDRSGRLQLPVELVERFPRRRVRIVNEGERIRLEAP